MGADEVVGVAGDEDTAQHVDDLDHSGAIDDDIAVAIDECEAVVIVGSTFVEHQIEARGVIGGLRGEGVTRGDQQVDVGTGEIID